MLAQGTLTLLDPWFLGLVPVALALGIWRLRRRRAALPTASVALLTGLPRSWRVRLVRLPLWLRVLALCALAVALARPATREVVPRREQGVEVLLVLDVSSSMDARDMDERGQQRRIEAARTKAAEFARGRPNDRVGLMTFARFADLRCPLTLDKQAVAAFLGGVEIVQANGPEDGTAVGLALAQAVRFIEHSKSPSRVVVLLTDGQQTVHEVATQDAAKMAKDAGVRVHTIGLGQGVLMSSLLGPIAQPVDFGELQQIATETGGRFFEAKDGAALAEVYRTIDQMEKVELDDPRYRTSDQFAVPLLAGVGLLALALLIELLWLRGVP